MTPNRNLLRFTGRCITAGMFVVLALAASPVQAQVHRYFVTYSEHMEQPGELEFSSKNVFANTKGANPFLGSAAEIERGIKSWWTTEVYLTGQYTANESTTFSGVRWENRFRPLKKEHWINPLLYAEFENVNGSDKPILEVIGHDGRADFLERTSRAEKERAAEFKFILGSTIKGWNISENFISEKNVHYGPWEFGYAVGVSRPLVADGQGQRCVFCRQNFSTGAEMYGGLGDRDSFGFKETSHYLAPIVSFRAPSHATFTVSPGFGLNDYSYGMLLRFGVSYEVSEFGSKLLGRH